MIDINKILNTKRIEVSFQEINLNSEYIKNFRNKYGLSQLALANIMNVDIKTVRRWEAGLKNINGSSSVLLYLLYNNPELIKQLYEVKNKKI